MTSTHDFPTGRQIEEAWRRVESALHDRHRHTDRRLTWLATSERLTCSRD